MGTVKTVRMNPLYACNTYLPAMVSYGVWSDEHGTGFTATENGIMFKFSLMNGLEAIHAPTTEVDFYDIFGFYADGKHDVWAVGTFGNVYRYDGNTFSKFAQPTEQWLEALWGRNAEDMYIGGSKGELMHFDGVRWTRLETYGANRLYSLWGTASPAEPAYAVGSFGTVIKIEGTKTTRLHTGVSSDFIGIQHVPDTSKFILCGTGGALFWLEDDRLTPIDIQIHTDPPSYELRLYGVHLTSEHDIFVVGWKGAGLHYNGEEWSYHPAGENSFLEGTFYIGEGKYFAAGWFGRIMTFDTHTQAWLTYQTGRAESVFSVGTDENGSLVATTDTGNILYGNIHDETLKLTYTQPIDFYAVAPLGSMSFLIAGDSGYYANIDTASPTIELSQTPEKEALLCMSKFRNGAYIGGQNGVLYRTGGDVPDPQLLEEFQKLVREKPVYAVAHLNEHEFYIQSSHHDVFYVNTQTQEMIPSAPKTGLSLLFGDYGYVYGIGYDAHLYTSSAKSEWEEIADLSKYFLSAGEYAVSGGNDPAGNYYIGGSRGSLIYRNPQSNTPSIANTGAYCKVASLAVFNGLFAAGLEGGRVQIGALDAPERKATNISGPRHYVVCPYGETDFIYGGESGTLGIFQPGAIQTLPLPSESAHDVLAAIPLDSSTVCCVGAGIFFIIQDGKINKKIYCNTVNITCLLYANAALYFGTSDGRVLTCNPKNLEDFAFETVVPSLKSSVVKLSMYADELRIILENGTIYAYRNGQCTKIYDFALQTLTASSGSENTQAYHIAGNENFLCEIHEDVLKIYTLPESIYDLTLSGNIGIGNYWVGGFSGTLLITYKNDWYLVNTGIGNQLYGIAANATGEYVLVGAAYGALRFDKTDYIKKAIEKGKGETNA